MILPTKLDAVNEHQNFGRRASEDNSSLDVANNDTDSNSMQVTSYDVEMSPSHEQDIINAPLEYEGHLQEYMR